MTDQWPRRVTDESDESPEPAKCLRPWSFVIRPPLAKAGDAISISKLLLSLLLCGLGVFGVGIRLSIDIPDGEAAGPPSPTPTGVQVVVWQIEPPILPSSTAILPSPTPIRPTPTASPAFAPTATPNPTVSPNLPWPAPTNTPVASTPETPLVGAPVEGPVTQAFGCSPFYTGIPSPSCPAEAPWFHDGLDLLDEAGTPVRAAITGTVIFAGPDDDGPLCDAYRGYGLGVVVDSGDGWRILYAHLSRIDVTPGQTVTPQTIIGAVGDTGCVSGAHLHFGLRREGQLVDPEFYLEGKWAM
jgi:murein DD-endopeptidase MepM/ murein hydrolase activator NlpD